MPFLLVVLVTLIIDQISKLIIQHLMMEGQSIIIIPDFFCFTYIHNPGAAFGFFAHKITFFTTTTLVLIILIFIVLKRISNHLKMIRISLGLIMGGALGNFIDRLRFGMVIDFLDFRLWPVFNLADTAIVIGGFLLLLEIWRKT